MVPLSRRFGSLRFCSAARTARPFSAVVFDAPGEVIDGAEDRTVRIGGPLGETVSVSVARAPGASTLDVVGRAISAVEALRPSLPPGVSIEPVQASLVRESTASARDAIRTDPG